MYNLKKKAIVMKWFSSHQWKINQTLVFWCFQVVKMGSYVVCKKDADEKHWNHLERKLPINTFQANILVLYPLKASEISGFWAYWVLQKGNIGLKLVNSDIKA